MMKKLLVLMLVLGMASIANAGLIDIVIVSYGDQTRDTQPIDPTSEITIYWSDWVDLDIVYTQPEPWLLASLSIDIIVTGPATLDLTELTHPVGAWDPGMMWITEVVPGKQYTIDYGMSMGVPGTGLPAIALDHILLHCEDLGDVIVELVENPDTHLMATAEMNMVTGEQALVAISPPVYIHQIPEPMTIALLGLGGLFLLRRRK